jgi:type I restriction enzyme S subunit
MSFSEWKKYRVGDIAKVKNGFAFKGKDFISSGVPVIKIKNVKPGKILLNELSYVSREVADNASKYKINVGDILITMSGNRIDGSPDSWVGKVAMFREEGEYLLNQRVGIIEINSKKIDSVFLSYLLSSIQSQQHFITKANSSGGQANISPDIIHDTEFCAPDLPEQKQIASILRSIDETIENNQQINKTLEEMAKAIFKEWFVDFIFPNATGKFQETEIGKIPVGWKVGKLGEVLEVKGGTTPSTTKKEYWDGEYYWTSPRDLSNLQTNVLLNTSKKITALGVKQISSGILPKGTLLLSSRAPIGYLAISEVPISINQGFIAINGTKVSNLFMMYWLKQNMDVIISNANGSTFLEISKTVFRNIPIAIPSKEVLENFEEIIGGIYNQILNNEKENQSLINLRDTLLPKLMKGEIEINSKADVAKV